MPRALALRFLRWLGARAVTYGAGSAILAAVLSFFAYNFFFIEPIYTFTIAEPHELFALLIFLLVAVLTGGLAGRVRTFDVFERSSVWEAAP